MTTIVFKNQTQNFADAKFVFLGKYPNKPTDAPMCRVVSVTFDYAESYWDVIAWFVCEADADKAQKKFIEKFH